MSGFLALLDDVAALTRLTAAQVDDVAAQALKVGGKLGATVWDDAAKAGTKAAGVVIDDAAVTPKYVTGLPATRELPIVWAIARGSLFNKLVILLPAALLLATFAPWLLTPLLMLGGAYLCFEGAEKVLHVFRPEAHHKEEVKSIDAAHLEKTRIKGAIKTDFILSAEIMTLSLAAIEADDIWARGIILAIVAVGITALVYGSVAILVKADDVGLKLSQIGRLDFTRRLGRLIVKGMPAVMTLISTIGTAAMLWVGGSIILHGLDELGWHAPYGVIHHAAEVAAHAMPASLQGFVAWLVTAALDGVVGLVLGFLLIPLVSKIIAPVAQRLQGRPAT
jgi:predicted DNA repair protein MutK